MEINLNSQLAAIGRSAIDQIDRIAESTDRLRKAVEHAKEKVINTEGFVLAKRGFDSFRQDIASIRTGVEQVLSTAEDPWAAAGEIMSICRAIREEQRLACGGFAQMCSMLSDEKMFGRIDDLEAMLAGQMVLLDELRSILERFEQEADAAAIRAEESMNCSGGWMDDVPDGYDAQGDDYAVGAWGGGEVYGECGADGSDYATYPSYMPSEAPCPAPSAGGYGEAMPCPAPASGSFSSPPESVSPGKAKKVRPARVDSVSFSVLSPERVKAGEYSSVDVYMYTKSQRKIIEKAIKAAESAVKETAKSGFSVSRGTEITVILTSDDVKITDETDTRTWDGECSRFDFQFFVPEGFSKKQIAFTCQVLFGGIQITRLHFTISLSAKNAARVPVKVKRKDCRKAFVSYSHKDEKRVLNQLAAIVEVAPRMVFWLDSQSLENGDVWRKEIQRAIRSADVFLLFWSIYSSKSEEVEKEWRYAKQKKGIRFILPVPLDPPAQCPPPEELGRHLHFGHRELAYTDGMDGLTFAGSRQLRKIK